MGRQAGYYEWDDDSLTPGMKKEGQWSQNLFDEDGRLKANARFVPTDDDFEFGSGYVTDTMYIPGEERQLSEEDKELRLLALAVSNLIGIGIERAKPHVKRWWNETAWPSMKETASKISHPRPRLKAAEVLAEAQARLIAAAAAHAYSDQQMRLVTNANIVDADTWARNGQVRRL